MKIVFHSEALRELREAQAWYAKQGAVEYAERLIELVDARASIELGSVATDNEVLDPAPMMPTPIPVMSTW